MPAVQPPSTSPARNAALSNAQLEAQIGEMAGHLNAANYRWLELIAEFDRRQAWVQACAKSCAHWLNFRCGLDLGAAREKVRVARALEALPRIASAMQRGELSYSKVRALTRVASAATETELLSIALHGTASQVEEVVRKFRQVQEVAELGREARQQTSRSLTYSYDDDGSLLIRARLPAESGTLVLRALEAAMEMSEPACRSAQDVSAETPYGLSDLGSTRAMQRSDALALLAESFLAHGAASLKGGERQQIVVHVDAGTLRAAEPGRCEIEHGPAIAAETARRLACDASIVEVTEDAEGTPLDVGRRTRSIPAALRRALQARDRGCRFPGCTHRRFVDGHHIEHWADGGATRLSNLVSLCRFHHRLLHEGRWSVQVLDDGAFRFLDAAGDAMCSSDEGARLDADSRACADDQHRQQIGIDTLAAQHVAAGLHIDARTVIRHWRGDPVDYDLTIGLLMQRAKRALDEPRGFG